jgi:vacuolar-type H+-ATPase subunit D/Vma8
MNRIHQLLFNKHSQFVMDVQSFENSLSKFTFDAQSHLSAVKDNMALTSFQHQSDKMKLKCIGEGLNKINKETLVSYIHSCTTLIDTSIALQNEYRTTLFKAKCRVFHSPTSIKVEIEHAHKALVGIREQLEKAYKHLAQSQCELKGQIEERSFFEAQDLQLRVTATHGQFCKLLQTVLQIRCDQTGRRESEN